MNVTIIQGANYGDAWPHGPYVDSTTLPAGYPDDALLFMRLSGDDRIAGKGHTTSNLWYWDGTWRVLMTATTPNFPVAFHPKTGELYIALGDGVHVHDIHGVETRVIPGYVGSQGIRQVNADGSIQTGDATYGDGIVSEYTDCGDVRIGQGHDGGGIVAIVDGKPRLVLAGAQQMVKANRVGDDFAIYGTDFKHGYRVECTRAELAAIAPMTPPVVIVPGPSPVSTPPSPPSPTPPRPIPVPSPSTPPVPHITPKGPTVIHVDGQPGFSGHKVDNGNGTFSIRKANGFYASFDPQGKWEERPNDKSSPDTYTPGLWESFIPSNAPNIAVIREGDETYLIAYVETPDA